MNGDICGNILERLLKLLFISHYPYIYVIVFLLYFIFCLPFFFLIN